MTKNRRYEARYDALTDARIAQASRGSQQPLTLPQQAYGSSPFEWAPPRRQPTVWVWVHWREGPATKIAAVAAAWNDRVVIVEWEHPGGRHSIVVWRTAVSHRAERDRARSHDPTLGSVRPGV